MRLSEFWERTGGLDRTTITRLIDAGVVRPNAPAGHGHGRPLEYSDADVAAALVYCTVVRCLAPGLAAAAGRAVRDGDAFVLVSPDGVRGFRTRARAELALIDPQRPTVVTLVDVAAVVAQATAERVATA